MQKKMERIERPEDEEERNGGIVLWKLRCISPDEEGRDSSQRDELEPGKELAIK